MLYTLTTEKLVIVWIINHVANVGQMDDLQIDHMIYRWII